MATVVAEKTSLPQGFAEWAKKYFKKAAPEPEAPLNLDALFNNAYLRFRQSCESQLRNVSKVPELKCEIESKLKEADAEESIPKLQAVLKHVTDALRVRREAVETKLAKLYEKAVWGQLDLRRDPNEARDTIRTLLKAWDIGEAEKHLKRFEEQLERARTLDLGEMQSIEKRHEQNKLQNAQFARNTQQALAVATRLITGDDGKVLMEGGMWKELAMVGSNDLPSLIYEIENSPQSELPQSMHALSLLKRLQTDEKLRTKLESISKPADQASTAADLIRTTLGLQPGTEITDAHARQAALSGLLFQARQTKVGSCFTTATATMVQRNNPGQFLDDISGLFKTGKLSRTIKHNGKDVTIEVPLSKEMLSFGLDKKTQVSRSNSNLHMAPDMVAAMDSLNIPADEQKKAVEDAARELRCERALKAALATQEDRIFQPPNTKAALTEAALQKLKADNSLSIRDALSQVFTERNVQLTTRTNAQALELARNRTGSVMAKGAEFDAPGGTDAFSPGEIIERMVKNRTPEKDQPKVLKSAEDAFLAQQDNFVQRSWEYSIATLEEKHPGKTSTKDSLSAGYAVTTKSRLDTYINGQGSWSGNRKSYALNASGLLKTEFEKLLKQSLDSRYDPSVTTRSGTVSQDGSSSFGGICLYAGDKKIETQDQFAAELARLFNQAKDNVTASSGANDRGKAVLNDLAAEMSRQFATKGFQDKIIEQICGVPNPPGSKPDPRDKMATPWTKQKGGKTAHLTQLYQNSPQPLQTVSSPSSVDNAEKLSKFLVGTMSQMGVGNRLAPEHSDTATIPVRTGGCHAFNLRPGDPVLLSLLKEFTNPDEAIRAFKQNEQDKNAHRQGHELKVDNPPKGVLKDLIASMTSNMKKNDRPVVIAQINAEIAGLGSDKITVTALQSLAKRVIDEQLTMLEPTLSPTARQKRVDTSLSNGDAPLLESVIPKGEFAPIIDQAMRQHHVPEEKQETLRKAIMEKLTGNSIDRDALAETIAKEIEKLSITPDPEKLKRSLIGPRGLVFADTNWGRGDHMTLFSMVVNPRTGEMELWQMFEDGTGAKKQDQNKWAKNNKWIVSNDPSQYGGNIGNSAWESKRGELQRKLNECISKQVGDTSAMVQALEFADDHFEEGQQDKADKALETLEKLVDEALKLAGKTKSASDALGNILTEIKSATIPEAKTALRVVERLQREVQAIREAGDVAAVLSRNQKLVALLKQTDLGPSVDLATVLAA